MNKLNKYIKKIQRNPKTNYLQKVAYYLVNNNNQIGGHSLRGGVQQLRIGGKEQIEDLLKFLQEKYVNAQNNTRKKYFVILYGPPASGKTAARRVAWLAIKKNFEPRLSIDEIKNSFIDTEIDGIVENTLISGKSAKDALIEIMETHINDATLLNKIKSHPSGKATNSELAIIKQKNIGNLASKTYNKYFEYRKNVDAVSDLLLYFSIYLNKNIYFETASGNPKYIRKLISTITYSSYGYIPILIYPFVNNVNILYDRSLRRGLKSGRFLSCGGAFGLNAKMEECLNAYEAIKKIFYDDTDNQSKELIIYKYNSDMTLNQFNVFKAISSIDDMNNLLLELETKVKGETTTNINKLRVNDYDEKITLNTNCNL